MVGFKSIFKPGLAYKPLRYWHFAIQARPQQFPFSAYVIKPHIVFTDDGINAWNDKKKMHSARRNQCRDWWNDDWRDRILVYMKWLAGNCEKIKIKLGKDTSIFVDTWFVAFNCPASFDDPASAHLSEIEDELKDDSYSDGLMDESETTDE